MNAEPLRLVAPAQREIADALPSWLGAWWSWTMRGIDEWRLSNGAVGRVVVAGGVGALLAVVAGIALVGHACRALMGRGK